ncbi:MAG: hypothetical protein Q9M92_09265 [Enterobacterales bacterium]|nr:hypothetical protein [Enterobacterales bacterium]
MVAIDGQHRLSALGWKQDPTSSEELTSWSIPVVILALLMLTSKELPAPNLLGSS